MLIGLCLLGGPACAQSRAEVLSVLDWRNDSPRFGGFSGIEIADDGTGFLILSDHSWIMSGRFERQGGIITGIGQQSGLTPLRGLTGEILRAGQSDSEGIAIDSAGGFYVSFEGKARVWHYADPDAVPTTLPLDPAFAGMPVNGSLEALAVASDGSILTLPERSGRPARPFPVFRFINGSWNSDWSIARLGSFVPVGADFGPDGRLYLLERDFAGIGFRTRIRRFAQGESDGMILFQSGVGDFDNLEGISVWAAPDGLRAVLISDDNYLALQTTQIVELTLPD